MAIQCIQLFATGCGSTIENANDFVLTGGSDHEKPGEIFCPQATLLCAYFVGIDSLSAYEVQVRVNMGASLSQVFEVRCW